MFYVKTNKVGSKCEEKFEYPDGTSDEEIEEDFKDWVWNEIEASFYELEE